MRNSTDQTAPLPLLAVHRLGPRPLALHLRTAMVTWTSSHAAWRSLRHDPPPWSLEPLQADQRLQVYLAGYLQDAGRTDNSQVETDGDAWATFLAAIETRSSTGSTHAWMEFRLSSATPIAGRTPARK